MTGEACTVNRPDDTQAITAPRPSRDRLWLIADAAVLLAYAALVAFSILRHEPWADEAEAWLMVRDLPFWKMLGEMHYEVNPALWHVILWVATHVLHLPYAALNWIAGIGATAGAAVLIFRAPFPRFLRYGIAFSFFLFYQYAVIARPYALVGVLAFLSIDLYRRRTNPILLAVLLSLLAHLSLYASILAGAIAAGYVWNSRTTWRQLDRNSRRHHLVALTLVALSFVLVVVMAFPASDCKGAAEIGSSNGLARAIGAINGALVGVRVISVILFVLLGVWSYRRGHFVLFILGAGGTVAFLAWAYGVAHHIGMITFAMIISIWAAWPDQHENSGRKLYKVLPVALAGIVCAVQIGWAVTSMVYDWKKPYTGAMDAANFIRSVHADQAGINACNYSAVAIQPYFERNIFRNWPTANGAAFYHNSKDVHLEEARPCLLGTPAYLIVVDWRGGLKDKYRESLARAGYSLVHYSPGQMTFQNGIEFYQDYLIFRRTR